MQAAAIQSLYALAIPALELAFGPGSVAVENQPFNFDQPPSPYVELEVEIENSYQVGMQVNPRTRYLGVIRLTLNIRDGEGTLSALAKLDQVTESLKYQTVDNIQIEQPKPMPVGAPRGWASKQVELSFHYEA